MNHRGTEAPRTITAKAESLCLCASVVNGTGTVEYFPLLFAMAMALFALDSAVTMRHVEVIVEANLLYVGILAGPAWRFVAVRAAHGVVIAAILLCLRRRPVVYLPLGVMLGAGAAAIVQWMWVLFADLA